MYRKILFVILLSFLLNCSFTKNVSLQPDFNRDLFLDNQLSNIKQKITFYAGEFIDIRSDTSNLVIFREKNTHNYTLYNNKPVRNVLIEGLKSLITYSTHQWSKEKLGDVQIDLELSELKAVCLGGYVSSQIVIKLDFIDNSTLEVMYTQIYDGDYKKKLKKPFYSPTGSVKNAIEASILLCISDVGEDDRLVEILEEYLSKK